MEISILLILATLEMTVSILDFDVLKAYSCDKQKIDPSSHNLVVCAFVSYWKLPLFGLNLKCSAKCFKALEPKRILSTMTNLLLNFDSHQENHQDMKK